LPLALAFVGFFPRAGRNPLSPVLNCHHPNALKLSVPHPIKNSYSQMKS
jgi:hypothetical protein